MRASLELNRSCNQSCVFCARAGLPALDEGKTPRERLAMLRATTDQLSFVGGEPTLVDELPELISHARSLGFTRIGLQTNALKLADAAYTKQLADAGLTDVHVTFLGAESAVHDYHSGTPGSFTALLTATALARSHGLTLVASTTVTRSNFRVLAGLPQLLASRGVVAWQLAMASVAGSAIEAMDRVVPRLSLAMPYVLHALEGARRLGLEGFVRDAPLCLLGPFAERALRGDDHDAARFSSACEACASRSACAGVDESYLARFGGEELQTMKTAAVAPKDSMYGALFTGIGDAVKPEKIDVPTPASKSREALFALGKSNAAHAEVASRDRKSGEALKEILPQLFER